MVKKKISKSNWIYSQGDLFIKITKNSTAQEIAPIAILFHELCGLPVTMRTKINKGVRVEFHQVLDFNYTGPVLEEVLKKGEVMRKVPESGCYKGLPVIVAPLKEGEEIIAAIGVVDITYGIYSEAMTIGRRRPKP